MINRQHFPPDKLEHLKIKEEENQIQRQYPIMHDQRGRGGIDMHEIFRSQGEMGVQDEEEDDEDQYQIDLEIQAQVHHVGEEDDIEYFHFQAVGNFDDLSLEGSLHEDLYDELIEDNDDAEDQIVYDE